MNIAVVVLDTLRKDAFDSHFNWLPGTSFENAWSVANYTVPVHGSLFAGKYPSELGVHAKSEEFDCPEPSLAEELSAAGYETRAYSANPLVTHMRSFDRGFTDFRSGWHVKSADPDLFDWSAAIGDAPLGGLFTHPYAVLKCLLNGSTPTVESLRAGWEMFRAPDDGAKEALSVLQGMSFGDQEFLFMNLMEAHGPYWPPKGYDTTDLPDVSIDEVSDTVLAGDADHCPYWEAYDNCVRYLSDMYRQMFAELRESFDIVITLADHGEMFGEHGASRHYHGVYEGLTHVPVVVWSGEEERQCRDDVVSVLDVHATVLERAGVDGESRGESLFELDKGGSRARLTEYLGFRPHRLEILRDRGFSDEEIATYDVELLGVAMTDDYYGFQTVDEGYQERGAAIDEPAEILNQLDTAREIRPVETDSTEIDEKTRRHLENLGYA
jgi:arylsulfatase